MHRNLKFLHMTNFSPHMSYVIYVTNMRYEKTSILHGPNSTTCILVVAPIDQQSVYISIIPIDGCDCTIVGSFVAKVMVYYARVDAQGGNIWQQFLFCSIFSTSFQIDLFIYFLSLSVAHMGT